MGVRWVGRQEGVALSSIVPLPSPGQAHLRARFAAACFVASIQGWPHTVPVQLVQLPTPCQCGSKLSLQTARTTAAAGRRQRGGVNRRASSSIGSSRRRRLQRRQRRWGLKGRRTGTCGPAQSWSRSCSMRCTPQVGRLGWVLPWVATNRCWLWCVQRVGVAAVMQAM